MRIRLRRIPGYFALAALVLVAAPGTVRADDWLDAKAEFRTGLKEEDWKLRQDAFLFLAGFDNAEMVRLVLDACARETNAAVVLAGVEALATLKTAPAREALFTVARKGKSLEKLLVLLSLRGKKGPQIAEVLLEVAKGRDGAAAAHAAEALGAERHEPAIPILLKLVEHGDWQVRAAAARTLAAYEEKSALVPLSRALAKASGRDRHDLIGALEKITGHDFGNDPKAWKKVAQGDDPSEILRQPSPPPTVFGIPIYGQRLVICLDNSLRMTDPHPFDGDRLRELCAVSEGSPIPWFRMQTNAHFTHGHLTHLIKGLPKGTKVEMLVFNANINRALGGLKNLGSAQKNILLDTMAKAQTDDGISTYPVLVEAMDIVSPKESVAWRSGPDEILFITVNMPTAGDVIEADLVAAAIGLKARLRMVPIHTVGIHYHPYDMCRVIAELTGGVYVNLTE